MNARRIPPLVFAASLLLAACGDEPHVTGPERVGPPLVYTTFYPTTYFTERIAGDLARVVCPLPDGADPATWRPDPSGLRAFQEADLVVLNGARFEKWALSASLPENRVVRTADSFRAEWIKIEGSPAHRHGPGGKEHSHEGIDGHTWMDPVLAKRQAAAIRDALAALLPEHEAALRANFESLGEDLDALDAEFRAVPAQGRRIVVTHPAWNYPARRYGWDLVEDADAEGDVRLWEEAPESPGPSDIVFSPCERKGDLDYLAAMRANLSRLKSALGR